MNANARRHRRPSELPRSEESSHVVTGKAAIGAGMLSNLPTLVRAMAVALSVKRPGELPGAAARQPEP